MRARALCAGAAEASSAAGRNNCDTPRSRTAAAAQLSKRLMNVFTSRRLGRVVRVASMITEIELTLDQGAVPYIPYRDFNYNEKEKNELWKRMYHFYKFNEPEFKAHYHRRSNVER
jgi:hypothetical protein